MATKLEVQYLNLYFLDSISPSGLSQLLSTFSTLNNLLDASGIELSKAGLDRHQINDIRRCIQHEPQSKLADNALSWLQKSSSHELLCFEESAYPALLREISRPPPLLFCQGDLKSLLMPHLAVVGSRNASRAGKQAAFWLGRELSDLGLTVCSGLAAGIDTQAHSGALEGNGGSTVAVMGTGPDRIYPAYNSQLAERICARGCLVTEFPPGSPPVASHFPRRNRIISGISLGVVVVEATLKSGSLITARLALEQNREVFAMPGSINNPRVAGCHQLIRSGAKLVDSIVSIVEELRLPGMITATRATAESGITRESSPVHCLPALTPAEIEILDQIGFDNCHPDALAGTAGMNIQRITQVLSDLEIKGLLEQDAGRFKRVRSDLQQLSD